MFGINGMEQNDTGALTPEQQQKLNDFKVTLLLFFVYRNKQRSMFTRLQSPVTTIIVLRHLLRSTRDLQMKDT